MTRPQMKKETKELEEKRSEKRDMGSKYSWRKVEAVVQDRDGWGQVF